MARPIWTNRPGLNPAEVRRIFGPGASLVQAGSGKWTIKNQTQGPGMTTQPTPDPAQPQAPAPAPAAPAPPPPPAPTDPILAAQQADVARRIDAAPGIFDEQRRILGLNTQRGLTDAGFFESVGLTPRTEGGSTAFELAPGEEGQLFRDMRTGLARSANRANNLFSSAQQRQQFQGNQALQNQAAGIRRSFGQQQSGITQAQQDYLNDLRATQGNLTAAQQQFGASQPVSMTPPPQPGEPGGPSIPTPANQNLIRLGPNRTRQQAEQLGTRRFGAGQFKVGQPGGGGGLVIKRIG